jgi:hypothetical protein
MRCGFKTAIVSCILCYHPGIRSSMQNSVFESQRGDVVVARQSIQTRSAALEYMGQNFSWG